MKKYVVFKRENGMVRRVHISDSLLGAEGWVIINSKVKLVRFGFCFYVNGNLNSPPDYWIVEL